MTLVTQPLLSKDSLRFWSRVDFSGECWEWKGHRFSNGYGDFVIKKSHNLVHRLAYRTLVGEIPPGLVIHHECENKACVNPDHLRACTQKENIEATLYRHPIRMRTHCPQGHPYDSIERCSGARRCSVCRLQQSRKKDAKRRARLAALRGM